MLVPYLLAGIFGILLFFHINVFSFILYVSGKQNRLKK